MSDPINALRTKLDADRVGNELVARALTATLRRFDDQSDPDGDPWPDYIKTSESKDGTRYSKYERMKRVKRPGKPLGVFDAHMRRDLATSEREIKPESAALLLGSQPAQVAKISWFDEGGGNGPRPARTIGISELEMGRIVDDVINKVLE